MRFDRSGLSSEGFAVEQQQRQRKDIVAWLILGLAIAFVILGWGSVWAFNSSASDPGTPYEGVNALFTGLALAFLVCGAWIQRADLEATREELRLTKEELAKQVDQTRQLADESRKQVALALRQAKLAALTSAAEYYHKTNEDQKDGYQLGKFRGYSHLAEDLVLNTMQLQIDDAEFAWKPDYRAALARTVFRCNQVKMEMPGNKYARFLEACAYAETWVSHHDPAYFIIVELQEHGNSKKSEEFQTRADELRKALEDYCSRLDEESSRSDGSDCN